MASTAITIQNQVTQLQTDIKATLEDFFASLPEMEDLVSMSTALVEQAKPIAVFRRDQRGAITVSDGAAFIKASEQVQALKSVADEIEELMAPFIDRLFKAHRTATAIRKQYLAPIEGEVGRLKLEREQFNAEEERKRRHAALEAQEQARKAEEARLLAEAAAAQAEGDSVAAEAILEEAMTVEAPPVVLPSTVPTVQGTSFFTVWNYEVQDWTKLKPELIKVDDVAIGKIVRSMHKAAEQLCGTGSIRVWSTQKIKG